MTAEELGRTLRAMHDAAERGDQTAMIRLFGIKYAVELAPYTSTEIVGWSGLGSNYHSEVSKGRRLAKYVTVKPEYAGKD